LRHFEQKGKEEEEEEDDDDDDAEKPEEPSLVKWITLSLLS